MKYEYDMDVPIPHDRRRAKQGGRPEVLRNMPVGASFFFKRASIQMLSNAWSMLRRNEDLTSKFTARTVTENGVKGVRVWRIE